MPTVALLVSSTALQAAAGPIPWAEFEPNVPVTIDTSTSTTSSHVPLPSVWSADELSEGFVVTPAGCGDVRTATGLDAYLRNGAGPIKGFDSPRIVPMPDGRVLWLMQDAFLDYDEIPSTMREMRYVNSAVLIQDTASCFTAVAHGNRRRAQPFEPGTGTDDPWKRFWWAGGASAASGQLQIMWIEMTHDPAEGRAPLDGPSIHPVATWLATYDASSLARISFRRAPDSGVFPIVGFDAVDDPSAGYTYLFGNTFLQNLALEPVPPFGAHSATVTTLARVPLGRLDLDPEFWTGSTWSRNAESAVPIAEEGIIEHIMRPQLIDGTWWSTTKPEGFLGDTVIVETASAPQGPWTLWGTAPATPHGDPTDVVTYAPVLAPWLDPDGLPIVVLSQIDIRWTVHDGGDPNRYRPQAFAVPRSS